MTTTLQPPEFYIRLIKHQQPESLPKLRKRAEYSTPTPLPTSIDHVEDQINELLGLDRWVDVWTFASAVYQCYAKTDALKGADYSAAFKSDFKAAALAADIFFRRDPAAGKLHPYQKKELYPALTHAFYLKGTPPYPTLETVIVALDAADYTTEASWLKGVS